MLLQVDFFSISLYLSVIWNKIDDDISEDSGSDSTPSSYGGDEPEPGYGDDYGPDGPGGGVSSAKELSSSDDIKKFLEENDIEPAVIGFFDESTNSADKAVFDEVLLVVMKKIVDDAYHYCY